MNIILGGTHGLGREIAAELHERGEETFVIGRSYNEAEHGQGMVADLTRQRDIEEVEKTLYTLGKNALTGFYWVSGVGYNGDFYDQPNPHQMAQVNFANVMPIAQAAWAKMLGSEVVSNFVVISSTTGVKARTNEAVYAATKHAQVGFTRSLGLESERLETSVRVALFMPGGMQTPFWDGDQPAAYDDFLDPRKVAKKVCDAVASQGTPYYEETIERGSL